MDDERIKKIEAGREKLAAYKKKKEMKSKRTAEDVASSQSSDSSLSLSLLESPRDAPGKEQVENEPESESSTISEHLQSSIGSIEQDRSYQEIQISNVISNFSLVFQNDDEVDRISQENKPPSVDSISKSDTLNISDVQSILNEILRSERFKSYSEHLLSGGGDSLDTNELSLNIFEGVSLDDSSINNYVCRPRRGSNTSEGFNNDESLNVLELQRENSGNKFVVGDGGATKIKNLEEHLINKDNTIAELKAELDSCKDSNHSTLSLNTSTTEYKNYHEDYRIRNVEFQNALAHRDNLIQQLTESLQQSLNNREELQQQSENFAKEISLLQKQLTETSNIIKQHKCGPNSKSDHQEEPAKPNVSRSGSFETVKEKNMGSVSKSASTSSCADGLDLDHECSDLEDTLNANQVGLFKDFKVKINMYIQQQISDSNTSQQNEIKILKDKFESEKIEYEAEVNRLKDLLENVKCSSSEILKLKEELDAKHAQEMEELRTYFEKKCADLEKHYSEEIFSQQSRKMSGSSSCCSEAELPSEPIYSGKQAQPGPGGDSLPLTVNQNIPNLTKKDLPKLKKDLTDVVNEFNKFDLDNLSKDDFNKLKSQLLKYDLHVLMKYDLSLIKHDMQNKYHAELEILREDYENRIDLLNVDYENKLQKVKGSYQEQIDALKDELNEAMRNVQLNVSTAVQEVASSGEFELAEVVQSYERRLQEQVTLAKIDIISALEHQIQMLANATDDTEWPYELLQIRDRFADKYEVQIAELKGQHQEEIAQLKEEHVKLLNGALERARRRSLRECESLNQCELDVVKDRDNLKKSNSVLRHLLSELLKYFTKCEDELNNTLVEEITKCGFDRNLSQIEKALILNDSVNSNSSKNSDDGPSNVTKRVHFTPNFADFMNIVDKSLTDCETKDLSVDLKNELGTCLERLRTDANAILALSTNIHGGSKPTIDETRNLSLEEKITSLTRQVLTDSQIKNDLTMQLSEVRDYVQNLESERVSLENQVEQLVAKQKVLETDLMSATKKISDLVECGHKEIISEGYGQNVGVHSLGGKIASLAELQERARTLVADWKNGADHPLIHLVEELCREGERITDEAKKDQHDLQQQVDLPHDFYRSHGEKIEAADKKLRATCRFLEEQAAEREQERDEAQREICFLREQLKEREKDKATCELVTKEVEQLEQQMRDMTKLIEDSQQKQQEVENERKEAVDKIWVLRDIIRDLEAQVETKSKTETELKNIINELEELVSQQNKTNVNLSQQLETYKNLPDAEQLKERIVFLETEVQKLRLNNELIGSEGAAKELQIQLNEFETTIEKRTRDLEGLHSAISTTSCSSPSEDMSIRDQIRSHTPSATLEECDVPLQQLARLKEKLVKHSRAEEAAVKRIRDLEMQLGTWKHDLEETQNEKEILQDQVSEQLILISSLQMRLDEQRLRAEHVQKQANTSLEVRIYDLENELQTCKETIHNRDKSIKQLNKVIEQTKQRLEDREKELNADAQINAIINLQQEIEHLRQENILLKTKIDSDAQNAQILPNLVDNIIADKNADIEKLRQNLSDTQKQLDVFLSFNLDLEQLKQLSQLKSPERAWSDILSLIDFNAPDVMRKHDSHIESMDNSLMTQKEISSIEKRGPSNFNYTTDAPLVKPNSTEIYKRVHFEDTELKGQINERDETISELKDRLKSLTNLEHNIEKLQNDLQQTEDALKVATETFEKARSSAEKTEKDLRIELAEKKMLLSERDKQLEYSNEDAARKDQMYLNLAKEKRELDERYKNLEETKNHEIHHLEEQLAKLIESAVRIEELESKLNSKERELINLQQKFRNLQGELDEKSEQLVKVHGVLDELRQAKESNAKYEKELVNKTNQISNLLEHISELKSTIEDKEQEVAHISANLKDETTKLKVLLVDRECEIEILNEDAIRYQNELAKLEEKLKDRLEDSDVQLQQMKNRKEMAVKDLEIMKLKMSQDDLNKEISHLQDYLNEKDKIIEQMKVDTKSLHVNLETIQNKIQETGNIVDLRKRLLEEQHLTAVLQEEINNLKAAHTRKERSMSIEEIAGQVQKELDYSARLDSSILQALSSGDEFNIGETEEKADLTAKLEHKLEVEKENVRRLETLLEKEKQNCNAIQVEDANLIEQMRVQLETALENENEFQRVLSGEKKLRRDLELQLKQKGNNVSASSNSKTEVTEYKLLPSAESQELAQLRRDVTALTEEAELLKADLKSLKRSKIEQDANFKYVKDMLQLKNSELAKLENKIEEMQQSEVNIKEKFGHCRAELEQRTREVENSRILMNELEQEKIEMKEEIETLKLRAATQDEREPNLSSLIPEKFLNKMKELSSLVKEHMNENTMMTETLTKLTNERAALQAKIRALEDQNNYKMPFDDPVARANHLFGKYLRSDSYRKALIWQKRYLISLLATYQNVHRPFNFEPKSSARVSQSSNHKHRFKAAVLVVVALVRMRYLVQRWHSGKRMGAHMHLSQYKNVIVQRDKHFDSHSAQFQLGQPVSSQNFYSHDLRFAAPLFRSNSQEMPNPSYVRNEETPPGPGPSPNNAAVTPRKSEKLPPWSGVTPPQKEKVFSTSSVPEHSSLNDNLAALEAPHLLSQCVKRFNEIQQRLGMTIENLNA